MTLENIEKIERIVHNLYAPYYYVIYGNRDYELEKWLQDKVLFYIKTGASIEELEAKLKKIEEKRYLQNAR